MRKIFNILFITVLLVISYDLTAQKAKKEDSGNAGTSGQGNARPAVIRAYLGHSDYSGGPITKQDFDRFLKQGLTARDSAGNILTVDGFNFSYAERNLYEDSIGNLMVLTDFFTEYCPGDTVSPGIANNIYYKTKPGDTAYFDNIKVQLPQGSQTWAKGMRFVLTK